jgi:hypothetical protein
VYQLFLNKKSLERKLTSIADGAIPSSP